MIPMWKCRQVVWRCFLWAPVLSLAVCWVVAAGDAAYAQTTERVSVASDGSEANLSSHMPAIGGDGRYVAFHSAASNLVGSDTNEREDVFVHDRQTGATERVSVASDGSESDGGILGARQPAINADGRYVAFCSDASDLVAGDTNGCDDIFVHDRQTGATERVSVASDGSEGDYPSTYSLAISGDGRYVAFGSQATNLVAGDTNSTWDVFLHDRQTGVTERVSVASDGSESNGPSYYMSVSGDGRYVAFDSNASDLVAGDTNGDRDTFVHDRQTGATTRVSVASDGSEANGTSWRPSISADGRYVAFDSTAPDLVGGDTNGFTDVFVHDRQTGATVRVSVTGDGGAANGSSFEAAMSADGGDVAFVSTASNLVTGDTNSAEDIFLYKLQTGAIERVSVAGDGTQANSTTFNCTIGNDGSCIAFESGASNLVEWDANGSADVFVRQRGEDAIFPDVPLNHWANAEVEACFHVGIVGGYPDGTYQPGNAVTRDQMAVYISRALAGGDENVPEFIQTPAFPDVPEEHWALDYVEYAVDQNVVAGYDDGTYRPEYEVTRDQMAVYVARALVAPTGEAVLINYIPADPVNFPDVLSDFWAYTHVEYCVENGVVQGYDDGYYRPEYVVTRDQMAVYVARAFGLGL